MECCVSMFRKQHCVYCLEYILFKKKHDYLLNENTSWEAQHIQSYIETKMRFGTNQFMSLALR